MHHAIPHNTNAASAPLTTPILRPLVDLDNGSLAGVDLDLGNCQGHHTSAGAPPGLDNALGAAARVVPANALLCMALPSKALLLTTPARSLLTRIAEFGINASTLCLFFNDQECRSLAIDGIEGMLRLKRMGFRLGLDITSLTQFPSLLVERLPVDVLRLDPLDSLCMPGDLQAAENLQDFSTFAANLLMLPAAKGVYSIQQSMMLRDVGIQIGQGPLYTAHEWPKGARVGS